MNGTPRIAVALVVGLLTGAALRAAGLDRGPALDLVDAIGGVWLDLLRMTVVPLVGSLLVVATAQVADAASAGRLTGRAIALFAVLLTLAALYSLVATRAALALWPIDPAAAEALRTAGGQAPAAEAPTVAGWLRSLVPANPVAAAAGDQILPVVVFSLSFGFGATRIGDELRVPLLTAVRAAAEALIQVVHGVLWAAPVGVLALAVGVGSRAGAAGASVLVQYLAI